MDKFVARTEDIAAQRSPLEVACGTFASKAVSVLSYVGQVVVPPGSFKVVELRMATKVLRIATSSLTTNCVYTLPRINGPKLMRPHAQLMACMIRTAAKTLPGFEPQDDSLRSLAFESLPLAAHIRGDYKPEGWDSEAFCTNLSRALKGELDFRDFLGAKDKVLRVVKDYQRGLVKGSLQKVPFNAIVSCTRLEFNLVFSKRLRNWDITQDARFTDNEITNFSLSLSLYIYIYI